MSVERRLSELIEQEREYHQNVGQQCPVVEPSSSSMAHNSTWRQMIVKWCYAVVDHIQADREVVYIAIHILDRFLNSQLRNPCTKRRYLTDRKDYEAAVMTALLITLKLHGDSHVCIQDILELSRSTVTTSDVVEVGQTLVDNLRWDKSLPTAARFAHTLIDMLPSSVKKEARQALYEETIFTIELSVHDQCCSSERPSLVAWMALENALMSHVIPQEIRNCFRAKVSKITGLKHDATIRRYLDNLQSHAILHGSEEGNVPVPLEEEKAVHVAVIPPDCDVDDDNDHLASLSYVQYSRPIAYLGGQQGMTSELKQQQQQQQQQPQQPQLPIIESNSIDRSMKRCVSAESNLPRSKRVSAFH